MKLKENRKLQIVFFVVSMAVLVVAYFFLDSWIEQRVVQKKVLKQAVTSDNNVLVEITSIKEEEETLLVSGWAVRLDAKLQGIKVVLLPLELEEERAQVLTASLKNDRDLQNYMEYLAVQETTGSGFDVTVDKEKLLQNVCYEIQVYANYEAEKEQIVKVSSKQYLYNGQVYPYNPLEFVAPMFTDEHMEKVVEEGYLLGYTMAYGAWVYQYENCLYWILDKSFETNLDENLYMFFHLNTPHTELLPESRRQHGFDNRDFAFKTNEVEIEGNYRVAMVEIEVEYPITYISIGQYKNNKNLWEIMNRLEIQ